MIRRLLWHVAVPCSRHGVGIVFGHVTSSGTVLCRPKEADAAPDTVGEDDDSEGKLPHI